MHRRLLVVDGRVGFTGGVGIADVWTGDAQDPQHWRETNVRVEGPAVRDVLGAFVENWTGWTHRIVGDRHFPPLDDVADGARVQVTRSSPTGGVTTAGELFYAAIAGARQRLWLTTAYFTAGSMFMGALADSSRRGVDVRVLVNGPNIDKELVRETAQHAYGPLLEAGVRIFEYQPTMLHAKVLIADDWCNVGSSNFDDRSFALDNELNLSLGGGGSVGELEQHFLEDMERSEEFDLARWRRRPLHTRVLGYAGQWARQSF
jgi:cardiolipin synthase